MSAEFTEKQVERIDEVYAATREYLCNLSGGDVAYDMALLGPVADYAADILCRNGYHSYFPVRCEQDDGTVTISDYYG